MLYTVMLQLAQIIPAPEVTRAERVCMEKIIEWLQSCGYSESSAVIEANKMIEANRWDGVEKCSREYAIEMILNDLQ